MPDQNLGPPSESLLGEINSPNLWMGSQISRFGGSKVEINRRDVAFDHQKSVLAILNITSIEIRVIISLNMIQGFVINVYSLNPPTLLPPIPRPPGGLWACSLAQFTRLDESFFSICRTATFGRDRKMFVHYTPNIR